MRTVFLHIVFICSCSFAAAQSNLIPNPGFEADTACPYTAGQVYFATPWFQPNYYFGTVTSACSSDLYNECAPYGPTSVPKNNSLGGYQPPKSGAGYCGFEVKNPGATTSREYIETSLDSSLIAGKTYCVEFYVALCDTVKYAISNIGAYFSVDSLLYSSAAGTNLPVSPQVENPITNMLSDTANWMLISGQFIASGGERFMTVGNFRDNASTNQLNVGGSFGYSMYYFDDFSVKCCNCSSSVPTISPIAIVIPSLFNSNESFEIKSLPVNSKLYIYNSLGQLLYKSESYKNEYRLSNLPTGIYYYNLVLRDGTIYKGKFSVV